MSARRVVASWLCAALVTSAGVAKADTADPCFAAPLHGQKLRRAGKLLEARDRFATCSRKTCPTKIVAACMRWMGEVGSAMPSVVLAARDEQGRDLGDVRVSLDGNAPVELSALAIELDPGPHRFTFQREAAAAIEREAVLHEGERNREVVAIFKLHEAPAQAEVAPPPSRPPPEAPRRDDSRVDARPADDETPAPAETRPIPASVWVTGTAGTLALASFAAFASLGLTTRANDHCAVGCAPSQYNDVTTELRAADASLVAGIVMLSVATVLYVTRPSVKLSTSAWIDVRPGFGASTATIAHFD